MYYEVCMRLRSTLFCRQLFPFVLLFAFDALCWFSYLFGCRIEEHCVSVTHTVFCGFTCCSHFLRRSVRCCSFNGRTAVSCARSGCISVVARWCSSCCGSCCCCQGHRCETHFRRRWAVASPYASVLSNAYKLFEGACHWGVRRRHYRCYPVNPFRIGL